MFCINVFMVQVQINIAILYEMSASEVKLHIQASDVEARKFLRASYDQNLQISFIILILGNGIHHAYTRVIVYLWYLYLLMGQCCLKMIILFPSF